MKMNASAEPEKQSQYKPNQTQFVVSKVEPPVVSLSNLFHPHRLWACFNFLLGDVVRRKLCSVTVYPIRRGVETIILKLSGIFKNWGILTTDTLGTSFTDSFDRLRTSNTDFWGKNWV